MKSKQLALAVLSFWATLTLVLGAWCGLEFSSLNSRLGALEDEPPEPERTEFRCGWCEVRETETRESAGRKVR
ncbi:MAG: hypothetical protein CMH55_07710 [Myxococcales bacterium]|nr:hypothetical protein [Myxococcales bacterium]